jgi:uncharacterized membrane protein (DUF373 family)
LIIVISAGLLAGIVYTAYDLRLIWTKNFYVGFKTVMVNVLTLLGVLEALRTVLAYYSEGRVRITLLVDAVLVTILSELLAFWYKEMDWERILMMICLALTLSVIRVLAVRFSPRPVDHEHPHPHNGN